MAFWSCVDLLVIDLRNDMMVRVASRLSGIALFCVDLLC